MAMDENVAQATRGELFEDGSMIEVVRDVTRAERLTLLYWNGRESSIATRVERNGTVYEAPAIDPTVVLAMALPTRSAPPEPARHLLDELATSCASYGGLDAEFARSAGRFILSTWLTEALPVAPSLRIVGPETAAGMQLFQILGGFCRHAVRLTGVDVRGLCSLPLQMHLTLLIRQAELNSPLRRLLDAARRPGEFTPRGKRLLELHAAVATYSELCSFNGDGFAGIEIPVPPPNRQVEKLQPATLRRMSDDFQARLLGYRLDVFAKARSSDFDAPQFLSPLRDLACGLAACTPDDSGLQAEVLDLLAARDSELRSKRWVNLRVVVLEALLGFVHEGKEPFVYVGTLAKAAEAILRARGETRHVEAREAGDELEALGLETEPRDSRGYKLRLTQELSRRVHERARNFEVPSIEQPMVGCTHCSAMPPANAA